MTAPTKRQIEAMLAVYHGRSPFEAPGSNGRYSVRSGGGAARRMIERIGDEGWFPQRYSRHGRCITDWKLTAAGLAVLGEKHPDLPDLADRIKVQRAVETEAKRAEDEERKAAQQARAERAEVNAARRIAAMREIAQSYQVRLELTDDQCLAMWNEIVERELAI